MKSTCIIFNPAAKGDKAKRHLGQIQFMSQHAALKPTRAAGDARVLAAAAVREGYQTIVAVGGDGTIHEVVNGIGDELEGFARVRLGILPLGTVNVFARELRMPFRFDQAWEVIGRGREICVDLPKINFSAAGLLQSRWFVQMAGCGLDARATELLDWKLKRRFGQYAYVIAAFKAMREKPATIQVTSGTKAFSGELVLLGNGRLYGGPIPVFRQADLQDGLLDICVFPKVNWFVILRYACAYISPRLLYQGSEYCFQAESVTLASAGRTPLELDGDPVGQVPASCTVQRAVLRVIVP